MLVETARFGSIEVDEERIIHFAKGVPGFEHVRQFVLVTPNEESPFSILQSVDEPGLAFVVTSPLWFRPDYRVEARREEIAELEIDDPDDVLVLAIITLNSDPEKMTANLLAPVLINTKNGRAVQLVLSESRYSTRHILKEELTRAERIANRDGALGADRLTAGGLRIVV